MRIPGLVGVTAVLVLALAALQASAQGNEVELFFGDADATQGEMRVPLEVRTPGGLGALEVEVHFDDAALRFKKVDEGRLLDNALVETKLRSPGRLRCVLASSEPIVEEGALFVTHFEVVGDASRTTIELRRTLAWDYENGFEMRVSTSPADVDLESSTSGIPLLPLAIALVAVVAVGLLVRRRR